MNMLRQQDRSVMSQSFLEILKDWLRLFLIVRNGGGGRELS